MKTKQSYLENLKPGQIIAFKNREKMLTAKVIEIEDHTVCVETRNGSKYFIQLEDVSWVKTGSRWPSGIYNALKNNSKKEVNNDAETEETDD